MLMSTPTITTLSSKTCHCDHRDEPRGEAVVKEEVVTLAAIIETNFRQGALETEVDGTKGDVTETESNAALSEWEEGRIMISDQNGAVVCLERLRDHTDEG